MRFGKMAMYALAAVAVAAVAWMVVWMLIVNNVETPDYRVVRSEGTVEIRDYPSMRVAQVVTEGERWQAVSSGFRPLANYIFAKNRDGDKIAMTAPVTQNLQETAAGPEAAKGSWQVRFIMPKDYRLDALPRPGDPAVTLLELSPQRRVAIRFSGVATDTLLAEQEAKLRRWALAEGIEVTGPPTFAYYNDPFTPGFLRRNEVLLDIANEAPPAS